MIREVNYLGVVVDDLEKETAFYRDTLGLAIDDQMSIPGEFTQFKLSGGALFSLQAGTAIPNGQQFEPAIQVEDVDAAYSSWRAQGVETLEEPHNMPFGRTFLFRTPAGHVFRVWAPQGA